MQSGSERYPEPELVLEKRFHTTAGSEREETSCALRERSGFCSDIVLMLLDPPQHTQLPVISDMTAIYNYIIHYIAKSIGQPPSNEQVLTTLVISMSTNLNVKSI